MKTSKTKIYPLFPEEEKESWKKLRPRARVLGAVTKTSLDLMKFVAMTTGYGRTTSTGVGFQGTGSAAKPEDYADRLLELYAKCLTAVENAK